MTVESPIIELKNIKIMLGGEMIHNGINLSINRGEIIGIVGRSGSGKTTLMREILMLQRPDSGSVRVLDYELMDDSMESLNNVERKCGVLFQSNALFSSLTLLENIEFPLREKFDFDKMLMKELALQKMVAVGLDVEASMKYPAQLSGGMKKRAGLARALVLDPEILFLDEPTSALDPESAADLDDLILDLQSALGLTIIIITHDLDTLWRVTNRVAFIEEGKILCVDSIEKLVRNPHKAIQRFFNGPRGRAAKDNYG